MEYSDYLIFVDESGDHSLESINTDYPVFVLCFCIIPKAHYFREVTSKIRELKSSTFGHDMVILHEHDIRRKKGAFSKLNKEAREKFMSELSQIMAGSEMTVIAIIVDKQKHKSRYANPSHPYHLAMQYGLERVYQFMQLKQQGTKLTHVICECRGKKEDNELELEFRRVCDRQNRDKTDYPFEIIMADKKTNSEGLQLADLMARPIGMSMLRPEQENRAYEIIKSKLFTGAYNCVEGNGIKVFPR